MKKMPALSLQQPNAEMILRGKKKIEYRKMATHKRERVYIYASKRPARDDAWREIKMKPGDLPTAFLVGTVEVVDCQKTRTGYEWDLANPIRLKRLVRPKKHPQPAWFYPF